MGILPRFADGGFTAAIERSTDCVRCLLGPGIFARSSLGLGTMLSEADSFSCGSPKSSSCAMAGSTIIYIIIRACLHKTNIMPDGLYSLPRKSYFLAQNPLDFFNPINPTTQPKDLYFLITLIPI